MNQQQASSEWNYLGTFTLSTAAGHRVLLRQNAGGIVVADAVKFVKVDGNEVFYVYPDQLGTPRVVTNTSNQQRWRWDSDPFGALPVNQNPASLGHFKLEMRFPGQLAIPLSGLVYNYFRDYDPSIGRYIQSDPVGLDGGINGYAYVENDPLSFTDPYGLRRGGGRTSSNTQACTYYQKVCSETGCRYYCYTAPMVCKTADFNPLFMWNGPGKLNCVRKCLIEEDQKARAKNQKMCAPNQPCLSNREIDDYHQQCFTKCQASGYPGVDPSWWPGPSLNPGPSN